MIAPLGFALFIGVVISPLSTSGVVFLEQVVDIRIDDLVVEVYPDARVVAAVVGSTGYGTMIANGAVAGAAIDVLAVPFGVLSDQVGRSQIPLDDAFVDVLHGKGKGKATAGGFAEVNPVFTVNLDFFFL